MTDVVKNVVIKYSSTGLVEQTTQVQRYDKAMQQLITTTYKGAPGLQPNQMDKVSEATKMGVIQTNKLGAALNSTMMRFIGLNAIISMGSQAYHELRKYIDESVEAFRSFEYKIAEVNSILDSTTRDTLPSLEIGITQLSVRFGKSVEDLSKDLYDIVSAAFAVDDAMGLLETVTKAAIAGITSVASAGETMIGVLNSYGLSAAHAAQVSDDLFQAVIRGVFTFSDLEGAMGYVTPIAANLGVSLDEVLSAMSAATRQGQHLDSVTRGLGLLIQGIVDPTTQAADAAKKYGIDMSATALRTYGLTGFLKQLSTATEKYGMQILPQLIGNMRSLRVAIALTGDTGLKGFTDDMELMATATGRTDDALAAMMNTQQMMANILEQSMQKVERSIGEAWSSVDIWWKKSQLWVGTLLSGGDAGKAIQDFDDAVYAIRQAYLDNLVTPANKGEKTILDKLTQGISARTAIPWESLNQFSKGAEGIEKYNKQLTNVTVAENALAQIRQDMSKPTGDFWNVKKPSEMTVGQFKLGPNLDVLNEQLTLLGLKTVTTSMTLADLDKIMTELNNTESKSTIMLENLTNAQSKLRPTVDQVTTAFEDMKSQINDTETSIVMIKSEISDLNEQLNVPYKGFTSMLEYELSLKQAENKMDYFQEYAGMASKYGADYINEFTNVFDQYGNNMSDILKTIYEYNDALSETSKETEELKKKNNDLAIAMAFNNLQMLKYELIGMIRRRGNTREEQRAMKKLQIENTKLRIEEMQMQYDADVKNNTAINSEKETAYDRAKEILTSYTDFEQHQLWILKDTRQEDTKDLSDNITEQKTLLAQRTIDLESEYVNLNTTQNLYTNSLITVANDPSLAESYRKFFGTDAAEEAISAISRLRIFQASNNITSLLINTPTVPSTPYIPGPYDMAKDLQKRGRVFANGTDYVPSTGLAIVHRGERIIPEGKNGGGDNIIININNPIVSNPNDISKLSNALENVVRANLINKQTGKSKRRMA